MLEAVSRRVGTGGAVGRFGQGLPRASAVHSQTLPGALWLTCLQFRRPSLGGAHGVARRVWVGGQATRGLNPKSAPFSDVRLLQMRTLSEPPGSNSVNWGQLEPLHGLHGSE